MSRIRIRFTGRKEEWTEGREKEVRHHVVLDAVNDVLFEDVDHEVEGDAESRTYTQMCMYNNITRAKIKIRAHPHTHPWSCRQHG